MRWIAVLGLGLMVAACGTPLPEPVAVADRRQAAPPHAKEAIPLIEAELQKRYPLTDKSEWEFKYLKPINGVYEAENRTTWEIEKKQYAGWFMCGTYKIKNVFGGDGLGNAFLAYFNPADGKFMYLIREERLDTAYGCNQLYGQQVMTVKRRN